MTSDQGGPPAAPALDSRNRGDDILIKRIGKKTLSCDADILSAQNLVMQTSCLHHNSWNISVLFSLFAAPSEILDLSHLFAFSKS